MASVYDDLDRPPLNERRLQRALMTPGGFTAALRVLPEVPSTNSALLVAAGDGAPHGSVVVTEWQTAGRGRLGRAWTAPPRSGLFVSILLRPEPPAAAWGWLPLLAGVAAREALARVSKLEVALKWPNDLIIVAAQSAAPGESGHELGDGGYGEGRKLGGILCEQESGPSPVVVVGIGLNTSLRREELPAPHATSVALEGGTADRESLLRALVRSFGDWYGRWADSGGSAADSGLAEAYRAACATLGRDVRAQLPGGTALRGRAIDVDEQGRLLISVQDGEPVPVAAADVAHLRSER